MGSRCSDIARRAALGGLAGTLAAGPAPAATISGQQALDRLLQGNARYRANHMHMHTRDFAAERVARVTTHRPIASVLSCSDARVAPEFLFDQGPGDLFVVRVAGNVLTDEGLASLEYAAQFLGSPLVFVLGHRGCGAVEAAVKTLQDNASLPGHLPGLIDRLKPVVGAAQASHPANLLNAAIAENIRRTTQAVAAAQPLLAAMVAAGKVKVAGGVYDIATGAVGLI
jgi:carbonic anhydrase